MRQMLNELSSRQVHEDCFQNCPVSGQYSVQKMSQGTALIKTARPNYLQLSGAQDHHRGLDDL